MNQEELLALLTANPTAVAYVKEIFGNLGTSAGRIAELEKTNNTLNSKSAEIIESRDKVKNIIKQELGLEEFTPDSIRARLATYAPDDVKSNYEQQITDLKKSSGERLDELNGQIAGKDKELYNAKLRLAISGTDVMNQTKGSHASDILLGWIAEDAVFDEKGDIGFKTKDGETIFNANGGSLTLTDRIAAIKNDETRDFVFETAHLSGGGAPKGGNGGGGPAAGDKGGTLIRSKMSFEEKQGYRSKYGEEAYGKLPLA